MEAVLKTEPLAAPSAPLIYKKIALCMADIKPIAKDQETKGSGHSNFGSFKFRGIDDVYNAVQQIMAKHGVFSTTEIIDRQHNKVQSKNGNTLHHYLYLYRFRFYAEDGSYIDQYAVGEAMDSGDKCANKCASIAHKYALLQLFCIPTDEKKDPDFEVHEVRGNTAPTTHPKVAKQRQILAQWLRSQNLDPANWDLDTIAELVKGKAAREWLPILKEQYPDKF